MNSDDILTIFKYGLCLSASFTVIFNFLGYVVESTLSLFKKITK